jgi:hypothetical protein
VIAAKRKAEGLAKPLRIQPIAVIILAAGAFSDIKAECLSPMLATLDMHLRSRL